MIEYSLPAPCCGVSPRFMLLDEAMVAHFASCDGGLPEAPFVDVAWRATCKPGGLFVDAGAHVGSWTLPFAAAGMSVMAFEPNPTIRALLAEAIQANQLDGRATVEPVALGEASRHAQLTCAGQDGGMASIVCRFSGAVDETVAVEPLDSYALAPAVLKIDVEGSELDVLRGATDTIAEHKPVLFFECWEDERGQRKDELFSHLTEIGYRVKRTWWPEMWSGRPC